MAKEKNPDQTGQTAQGPVEKVNPVQVQKFLKGIDYPADKNHLMDHAKNHGADDRVMNMLGRIPSRTYNGPNAISKAIGEQE